MSFIRNWNFDETRIFFKNAHIFVFPLILTGKRGFNYLVILFETLPNRQMNQHIYIS